MRECSCYGSRSGVRAPRTMIAASCGQGELLRARVPGGGAATATVPLTPSFFRAMAHCKALLLKGWYTSLGTWRGGGQCVRTARWPRASMNQNDDVFHRLMDTRGYFPPMTGRGRGCHRNTVCPDRTLVPSRAAIMSNAFRAQIVREHWKSLLSNSL